MASWHRSLWSESQKHICAFSLCFGRTASELSDFLLEGQRQEWLLTPVTDSKAYFELFKTAAPIMDDFSRWCFLKRHPCFFHFLPFLCPSVEVPQPGRRTSDFNSWPLNAEVSAAAAAISHSRWKGNEHRGCWGWHGALTTPAIATLNAWLHQAGICEELRRRCSDWGHSPV